MRDYLQELARASIVGAIILAVMLTVFGPKLRQIETQIWWLNLMHKSEGNG